MTTAIMRGAQKPAGHPAECLCVPCLNADMDAHLIANGIDPARYPIGSGAPERTRGDGSGRTRRAATAERGATDGQLSYLADLARDREYAGTIPAGLSFDAASKLIDELKLLPWRDRAPVARVAAPVADVEPGMYLRDGVIYRAQRSRTSGRVYAKVGHIESDAVRDPSGAIVTPAVVRFEFEPGAVALLTPEHRMTFDQAREFGAVHGVCVYGHPLTDPLSVAAGIGPVCARKFGVSREELAAAAGYVRPTRTRKAAPVAQVAAEPAPAAPATVAQVAAPAPFTSRWGALAPVSD